MNRIINIHISGLVIIFTCFFVCLTSCNKAEYFEVALVIRNHEFTPSTIHVPSNKLIKLLITNEDKTVEEFESPDLAREKMISPGQTVAIILAPLKPGEYKFFGEFHSKTAQGLLISE